MTHLLEPWAPREQCVGLGLGDLGGRSGSEQAPGDRSWVPVYKQQHIPSTPQSCKYMCRQTQTHTPAPLWSVFKVEQIQKQINAGEKL